jgi:hypothetical protein
MRCFSLSVTFPYQPWILRSILHLGSTRDVRDGFWAASSICQKSCLICFSLPRDAHQRFEQSLERWLSIGMDGEGTPPR